MIPLYVTPEEAVKNMTVAIKLISDAHLAEILKAVEPTVKSLETVSIGKGQAEKHYNAHALWVAYDIYFNVRVRRPVELDEVTFSGVARYLENNKA